MGNVASQALCEEEKKDEQPEVEQAQDSPNDSGSEEQPDVGTGEGKDKPNLQEPKTVRDDSTASAKEAEKATEQKETSAQASSKAGMAEPVSVRKYSHEHAEQKKQEHNESGGNKSTDAPDPDDEEHVQVKTVPYDPRFPATNQARNCYTRYNEYYKCIQDKDEEDPECKFYQRAYRSLCPSEWLEAWNTARDEGNWFGKY